MPIIARLPDGTGLRFPDGTDPSVIDRAMKAHVGGQGEQQPKPPGLVERLKNYVGESVEALGEGAKAVGQSLLPTEKGAEAKGEIAGSVLEGTGAFAGGEMAPGPASRVPLPPKTAGQGLLQDFERLGISPSVPAVGQGRAAGLAANLGRSLPFSPVAGAAKRGIEETGKAAERVAGGYGEAATPEAGGAVAQNATRRFAADKSQAARDYGAYYAQMHGAKPSPITNTLALLRDLRGRFPNAPGLAGLFSNPKLARLSAELEPKTTTIPAKTSSIMGPSGSPIVTAPARTVTTGGALSTPELKELHTQIGYLIEQPEFGPEAIPKAQLRRLYGALTRDMQAAARAQGPGAVKALAKATLNYGVRMRTMERLDPILRADAPEKSFMRLNQAAQSSGSADARLLQSARGAMTPEEWGDVGAATIRKLGVPTPGTADALGSPFSVSSFGTNWAKLSDHAKDLLFGADVPGGPRAGLEALSRVVAAQKNVSRLANTSHSGEMAVIAATIEEVTRHIAQGQVPWATAMGLAGSYGLSKMLMSPAVARWIYRLPQAIEGAPSAAAALPRALTILQMEMSGQPSQDRQDRAQPAVVHPPGLPKPPMASRDYLKARAAGERPAPGSVQLPSGMVLSAP